MKNIEQILEEEGITLTEDKMKRIKAAVSNNYRTVADYKKQIKRFEDANKKNTNFQAGRTGTAEQENNGFDMIIRIKNISDLEYILKKIRG